MDTTNICHITSTWLYKKVQYQYSPEKKKKKKIYTIHGLGKI